MVRSEAVVDLDAIRDNVALLRSRTPAEVMAVVKADGYGHGLVPSARAALAGGATWLGAAFARGGAGAAPRPGSPRRCCPGWPAGRGPRRRGGRRRRPVRERALGGRRDRGRGPGAGRPARVHLKIDTGLSRGGAPAADWPDLVDGGGQGRGRGRRARWSASGATSRTPTRPGTRPSPASRRVRRGARVARRLGRRPPAAAPGQLGGHADRAGRALRPGPAGLAVYGLTRCPPGRHGLGLPGDDAAAVGGAGQAGAGRQRRLVRPRLHDRPGDPAGPGPARLRRRGAAQRHPSGRCSLGRPAPDRRRPGVHGPVRRRRRRRRGGGRRRGRAVPNSTTSSPAATGSSPQSSTNWSMQTRPAICGACRRAPPGRRRRRAGARRRRSRAGPAPAWSPARWCRCGRRRRPAGRHPLGERTARAASSPAAARRRLPAAPATARRPRCPGRTRSKCAVGPGQRGGRVGHVPVARVDAEPLGDGQRLGEHGELRAMVGCRARPRRRSGSRRRPLDVARRPAALAAAVEQGGPVGGRRAAAGQAGVDLQVHPGRPAGVPGRGGDLVEPPRARWRTGRRPRPRPAAGPARGRPARPAPAR